MGKEDLCGHAMSNDTKWLRESGINLDILDRMDTLEIEKAQLNTQVYIFPNLT